MRRRTGPSFPSVLLPLFVATPLALAQTPVRNTLVADIETAVPGMAPGSDPESVGLIGGYLWFAATRADSGRELWVTEGRRTSAARVSDLVPGPIGSDPRGVGVIPGGTVLFSAGGAGAGRSLYSVTSVSPNAAPSLVRAGLDPFGAANWQQEVWFLVDQGAQGRNLWRSDGTSAGTVLADDLSQAGFGAAFRTSDRLVSTSQRLWGLSTAGGRALWVKDSTTSPLRRCFALNRSSGAPNEIHPAGGGVVYADGGGGFGIEPWFSDGTPANTVRLADFAPGVGDSVERFLAADGQRVWMMLRPTPTSGRRLAVTDGTPGGTRLVPGADSLHADSEAVVEPRTRDLVFVQGSMANGVELWRTDGTAVGTRLVADVEPGPGDSLPRGLDWERDFIYFSADALGIGRELYRYDPTNDGLQRFAEIEPGPGGSDPVILGTAREGLVLRAFRSNFGVEPWRLDLAAGRADVLFDVNPGISTGDSNPNGFLRWRDLLFFRASTELGGVEPYVSDGTTAGTRRIGDLVPGRGSSAAVPLGATDSGVILRGADATAQLRLWISDGSGSAPRFLPGFEAATQIVNVVGGVESGGSFFFVLNDSRGTNLWRTDGTAAGTRIVTSFPTGQQVSFTQALPSGLLLGHSIVPGSSAGQLWVSDGTAPGTRLLRRFTLLRNGGGVDNLTPVGNGAVFASSDGVSGRELWFTDGTVAGTRLVLDLEPGAASSRLQWFCPLQDFVLFVAGTSASGLEIWRTDGTTAGTRMVADLEPGAGSRMPNQLVAGSQDQAWFWANGSSGLVGLWITDGTAAGTRVVRATRPDGQGFSFNALAPLGDGRQVAFAQYSRDFGSEVWVSDGTAAGTRVLTDSNPGAGDARPDVGDFGAGGVRVGNLLFFTADDGQNGRELHAVSLGATGAWLAQPYGEGCGATLDASGAAVLGQAFAFEIETVASSPVALAFGVTPTAQVLVPGCSLHIAGPETVAVTTSDGQGRASVGLTIPNMPELVGDLMHFQAFAVFPGGPAGGGTNGLEVVVGR